MGKVILAVVVLGAAFLAFGAYLTHKQPPEQRHQREAIEHCRALAADAMNPPAMTAGCDQMEADYVTRWGAAP